MNAYLLSLRALQSKLLVTCVWKKASQLASVRLTSEFNPTVAKCQVSIDAKSYNQITTPREAYGFPCRMVFISIKCVVDIAEINTSSSVPGDLQPEMHSDELLRVF